MLRELEKDVTTLYEEWAQYLRSMQAPTPTVELVPLSPLLHEVVLGAQARTQQVPITLEQAAALPDIRGDRMLLREALLNVVSNAAEACAAAGGEVVVRVRAIAAPAASAAPIVEVVISDNGPGIPRAHLGRLFVPGFTTKGDRLGRRARDRRARRVRTPRPDHDRLRRGTRDDDYDHAADGSEWARRAAEVDGHRSLAQRSPENGDRFPPPPTGELYSRPR